MTFQDDITRMLAEGNERLERAALDSETEPLTVVDIEAAAKRLLTVKHYSAYIPVSTEQALDAGLITEEQARAQGWTPYVPPSVPWLRRARWRWQSWRERVGRRVGGWLAGVDLSERDED